MKNSNMVGNSDAFVRVFLVLLLLSSLFIFSDSLTGLAPLGRSNSKEAVLHLSSSKDVMDQSDPRVYAGSMLYLTLETGDKGTNTMYSIYDAQGNRIDQRRFQNCRDSICRNNQVYTSEYLIGKSWMGDYSIQMVERQTYKPIEARFTVISRG